MKYSKGIITIPDATGDINIEVKSELLPIELYSGDASKYALNKAVNTDNYSISDLNGRYLTDIIPVDFTRRKCLSIYGLKDGYLGGKALYKIFLYKAGVISTFIWTSNFYHDHDATEGHIDLSTKIDNIESYDGIRFEISTGKGSSAPITADDVFPTNQVSIILHEKICADITDQTGYTFDQYFYTNADTDTELTIIEEDEFVSTGIIEIAPGDTIRIKGMYWLDVDPSGHSGIAFYKEDKVFSGKFRSIYKGHSSTGTTYSFYDTDGDGITDVIEIHASEAILNNTATGIPNFKTTGIKVCGRKSRAESLVITRNLKIDVDPDYDPNYFNVLPFSTNTDGTDFVGTHANGGDGYEYGYRIESNGTISQCDGMYVSGFIPVCSMAYVYIKNIAKYTTDESYNRIAFYSRYDKAFNGWTTLIESNSALKYGNGTYRISPSAYSQSNGSYYIRFCCGGITDETIVSSDRPVPHYTNLAMPNPTNTTDKALWVNGYRFGGTTQDIEARNGKTISNFINCRKGDVIRIKGVALEENSDRLAAGVLTSEGVARYVLGYFNNGAYSGDLAVISYNGLSDGIYTFTVEDDYGGDIIGFRFSMNTPTDPNSVVITVNEEIVW